MTVAKLKSRTVKDLAVLAKRKGVPGWHSMRKEELIKALVKHSKPAATKTVKRCDSNGHAAPPPAKPHSSRTVQRLNQIKAKMALSRDLAYSNGNAESHSKDRLVLMVRGPFWLHAYWELTRQSVERARAALGPYWHAARPVLRLFEVKRDGTTSTVRKIVRDIEIHGGVNDWYIDVQDPPKSYQMDVGYAATEGKFVALTRSNVVSTPPLGSANAAEGNWSEVARDCDRIYALSGGYDRNGDSSELKNLFEERLRRPMGTTAASRFGLGPARFGQSNHAFAFEVDAELVVFGAAEPGARVLIKGEPVRMQADGTFVVRFNLPDRRQVLPIVASSADGVEQRTVVLAVERNTKVMEALNRGESEG
ncbi:MAG: DUF4912 domain-containing protein [Thermoguttaceae bacterium]|jgi:hypothetical protein